MVAKGRRAASDLCSAVINGVANLPSQMATKKTNAAVKNASDATEQAAQATSAANAATENANQATVAAKAATQEALTQAEEAKQAAASVRDDCYPMMFRNYDGSTDRHLRLSWFLFTTERQQPVLRKRRTLRLILPDMNTPCR